MINLSLAKKRTGICLWQTVGFQTSWTAIDSLSNLQNEAYWWHITNAEDQECKYLLLLN